jgi:succinate-semialdehyde dehydrogenase/glutarate-semialdehyde dehydrogenase
MKTTMKMLINGCFVDASDGRSSVSVNPATGEVVDSYPLATEQDIKAALDAAQTGKRIWSGMSFNQRAAVLNKAADIFEKHIPEMGNLVCRELGKQIGMATGEAAEVVDTFRRSVAAAMHKYGAVYPNPNAEGGLGDIALTVHEPLGVVCCIAPFNFPIATLTFKVAPSLIMGNAVIIKAPSDVPVAVLRFTELLHEAGFPDGVVQSVSGEGSVLSNWMIDNDKINAVSFTGSTQTAIQIVNLSAKHLHRMLFELGGNDAMIICDDADIDKAVGEAMSRILNSGQVCCQQKRFLVHNSRKEEFVDKLIQALRGIKIGDPTDPAVSMGPCVSERAAQEIERQIQHTVSEGGKLVYGGTRKGAFITPAVLDDLNRNMDVAKDMEIFGPVFPVFSFDDEDEAIDIANQSSYGLNGGVMAGDLVRALRIAKRLEAGTVVANGAGFWRRDIAPFGGYKKSGWGREGLEDILDEVSQRKTIVINGI